MKLCLFTDDMIIYVKNLKESAKKLLEVIILIIARTARYKVNMQKNSITFKNTSNKLGKI